MTTLARALACTALLAGCISADTADERWQAWLDEHDSCEVAEDCVVIYPGCPLGCTAAVAAEHEQDAVDEAARLIKSYERAGRACDYDCALSGPAECESGSCVVGPPPDTGY